MRPSKVLKKNELGKKPTAPKMELKNIKNVLLIRNVQLECISIIFMKIKLVFLDKSRNFLTIKLFISPFTIVYVALKF
ncbi:hypothetical protein BpHYR1_010871 [Brachionus plicatilis]|uniref:Uncharacterized protein n=1 Tax=Brachionus plicatilis TaxID=10195 RepID=A0A3M7QP48_BRAPC|nr:hypothetical protein BpHYR1_010871 [Brachionus plicatilis]